MKTILILMALSFGLGPLAFAQNIFEDAKGESSLLLTNTPWAGARLNTGDDAFTLGFNYLNKRGFDGSSKIFKNYRWQYGADAKVNAQDGIGSIVKKGKSSIGYALNFNFGIAGQASFEKPGNTTNDYSLFLRAGYSYDKFKLIDVSAAQLEEIHRYHPYLELHYNKIWVKNTSLTKQQFHFFGVSIGTKRANNIDNLEDGQINTILSSQTSSNVTTVEEGKIGSYQKYATFPLKIDYGYLPWLFRQNQIGFNAYGRTSFNMPDNPVNAGLGVFFANPSNVTSITGGVALQFNDVFDNSPINGKNSVFFYVGYTIK